MSTVPLVARRRLHRSELAVSGSRLERLDEVLESAADAVFFDLEDTVGVAGKDAARSQVLWALREVDWRRRGTTISVRVNGVDTPWCWRDLVAVGEAADRVDVAILPMVNTAADVEFAATLLRQVEQAERVPRPVGLAVLIETAAGLSRVDEIAAAAPGRLESLIFGVGDFTISTGARIPNPGSPSADYAVLTSPRNGGERELHWQAPWHYAMTRILVAARANGLRPIDGPFADTSDPAGYRQAALMAAALGFEGKWAIDEAQVAVANDVFAPRPDEVDRARTIVAAAAAMDGSGVVEVGGHHVDAAAVEAAAAIVARSVQIEQDGRPPAKPDGRSQAQAAR